MSGCSGRAAVAMVDGRGPGAMNHARICRRGGRPPHRTATTTAMRHGRLPRAVVALGSDIAIEPCAFQQCGDTVVTTSSRRRFGGTRGGRSGRAPEVQDRRAPAYAADIARRRLCGRRPSVVRTPTPRHLWRSVRWIRDRRGCRRYRLRRRRRLGRIRCRGCRRRGCCGHLR